MKKINYLLLSTASAFAVASAASPARAEFADYGSLESIFGEPVTTSATGSPKKVSEVPIALTIVTAEQIQRAAAVDIPGILREYTDLDVWTWARGNSDVSARGYNSAMSSRMLVLINGRQVYLDYRGFTDWQTLPVQLSEIRQIEVIKGPNSALFGFNAAGGVINIITFNPLYDTVNNATLRFGTDNYREASAVVTARIADIGGIRLSAGGFDADAFDTTSTSAPSGASVDPSKRAANLDAAARLGDSVQARLEASYAEDHLFQYLDFYSGLAAQNTVWSVKGSVNADTDYGLIDGTIYHNHTDVEAGELFTVNNPLTVVQLQDLLKIGKDHILRLGLEYRYESMNSIPESGLEIAASTIAASAMWEWAITPRLTMTNALRFDHLALSRTGTVPAISPTSNDDFDRTFDEFSFNSGVVYKITDVDSIRVSVGRGLQMPNLMQFALNSSVIQVAGNPYLQPITVTNYELGYSHDFTEYGLKLNSALFWQDNSNLIVVDPYGTVFPGYFSYADVGDSSAIGFELGVEGKTTSGFRYGASYRFEHITDDLTIDDSTQTYPINYSGSAPHHMVGARAGYTWGKVDIDLFARYSSAYSVPGSSGTGMSFTDDFEVPAAFSLDARVAYALTDKIELAVHGVSIQSETQTQTTGPDVEHQIFGTITFKY